MDVQTLCLGSLTLGEASGYEIKKLFEEGPFAYFYHASYGSIYPALGNLLKKELNLKLVEELVENLVVVLTWLRKKQIFKR